MYIKRDRECFITFPNTELMSAFSNPGFLLDIAKENSQRLEKEPKAHKRSRDDDRAR